MTVRTNFLQPSPMFFEQVLQAVCWKIQRLDSLRNEQIPGISNRISPGAWLLPEIEPHHDDLQLFQTESYRVGREILVCEALIVESVDWPS